MQRSCREMSISRGNSNEALSERRITSFVKAPTQACPFRTLQDINMKTKLVPAKLQVISQSLYTFLI